MAKKLRHAKLTGIFETQRNKLLGEVSGIGLSTFEMSLGDWH